MDTVPRNPNHLRKWKLLAASTAGALILAACSSEGTEHTAERTDTKTVSLLEKSTWNQGGVKLTSNSLKVHAQNRAIVEQSGEAGEANPSINLYGTVLEHEGDFSVSLTIDNQSGPAEIMLYGKPPVISDEFRSEQETLRAVVADNQLLVDLSNETEGDVIKNQRFDIESSNQHELTIISADNKISFRLGDDVVGEIGDHGIFKASKRVWFGVNALDPEGSFDVMSLDAKGENGGTVRVADTRKDALPKPDDSSLFRLAEAKRPGFEFGAAVALGPMVADEEYRDRLFNNFNTFTPENAGKWQFIHPKAGNGSDSYDFTEMDAIVDMAERSGAKVHGHTLVFGEANPQWLQDLDGNPKALEQAMDQHITKVLKHFDGKVMSWDLIDEALADYDTPVGELGLRKNIWYRNFGSDYLPMALRIARKALPKGEFYISDFGMEADSDRFETMKPLVQWLKKHGLNGVSFQSHVDEWDTIKSDTHIDIPKFQTHLKWLEDQDLKSRISELDISNESEHAVPSDFVQACLGIKACKGVNIWGVGRYSSGGEKNADGTYSPGFGLPWDENYKPTRIVKDLRRDILH